MKPSDFRENKEGRPISEAAFSGKCYYVCKKNRAFQIIKCYGTIQKACLPLIPLQYFLQIPEYAHIRELSLRAEWKHLKVLL
jgi:hypothetical protein